MNFFRKSIKTKLFLMSFISLLIVISVLTGVWVKQITQQQKENFDRMMEQAINEKDSSFSFIIKNLDYLCATLATDKDIIDMLSLTHQFSNEVEWIEQSRKFDKVIETVYGNSYCVSGIIISGTDSEIFYSLGTHITKTDIQVAEWYPEVLEARNRSILIPCKIDNKNRLFVARTIEKEKKVIGFILAELSLNFLDSVFLSDDDMLMMISQNKNIVYCTDYRKKSSLEGWDIMPQIKTLREQIFALDREGMHQTLEIVFQKIPGSRIAQRSIYLFYIELYNLIQDLVRDNHLEEKEVWEGNHFYKILQSKESVEEMNNWITEVFERLFNLIYGIVTYSGNSLPLRRAVQYINTHFTQDISQMEVAEAAEISGSYLSKLFKQEMGVSFMEYLNSMRIRYACSLLQKGGTPKSIYHDCGFRGYTYFFKVFKRIAGITPFQYIQKENKML